MRWVGWSRVGRGAPLVFVFDVGLFGLARINSIMFSAIWTSAPILVSLISFAAYVYQGNRLTVAIAFTVCTSTTCAGVHADTTLGHYAFQYDSVLVLRSVIL